MDDLDKTSDLDEFEWKFSEELRILDRNTVIYMLEEQMKEIAQHQRTIEELQNKYIKLRDEHIELLKLNISLLEENAELRKKITPELSESKEAI